VELFSPETVWLTVINPDAEPKGLAEPVRVWDGEGVPIVEGLVAIVCVGERLSFMEALIV
jgi:hypothetical protein